MPQSPFHGISHTHDMVYGSKGHDKAAIKREQSEARFDFAEREQARPIGQGGCKGHGREMVRSGNVEGGGMSIKELFLLKYV